MSIAEIHQTYSFWCNYKFQPKKGTWRGMLSTHKLCRYFQILRYITVRTSRIYLNLLLMSKTDSWLIDEYEIDLYSADDYVLYNSILLLYFFSFPFKDIFGPRLTHKLSILRFITLYVQNIWRKVIWPVILIYQSLGAVDNDRSKTFAK